MNSRKSFALPASRRRALALAALAFLLASCGGGSDDNSSADGTTESTSSGADGDTASTSDSESGSDGETDAFSHEADGTISYAFSLSTPTLDPGYITSIQAGLYLNPVYDRLTYIDPVSGVPGPMLATSWEVGEDADGPFVDFTLREGLTFPDGAAFGPETVIANIERSQSLEGQGVNADLSLVTGAEMTGPNVVRVRVSAGAAALPGILGARAGMMISQDALDNPDLATNPVGIGMWTLENFDPAKVSYVATPEYWDPEAQRSERLELLWIGDDSARFNALRSGDIDVTFIRSSQLESAEDAGLHILQVQGATNYIYMLNTSVEPLDNSDVRRAMAHAIDRQGISDALLGGLCTPNDQLVSPASPYFDPDREAFPYDPDEAMRLLEEAGYGDGFSIKLLSGDVDFYRRLAEVVQAQLAAVGITAELTLAPLSEATDRFVTARAVDGAAASPGLESDPSAIVSRYLLADGLFNPGGYQNAEIDEKANAALLTSEQSERERLYREISNLASDDAPFLAICAPTFLYTSEGEIDGFAGGRGAGTPEFRGVAG